MIIIIELYMCTKSFLTLSFPFMLAQKIENESAKAVLNNVESITEEKIDELLNKFMKDFKEGLLEEEGWQPYLSACTVSKAALKAYTRMLDNNYSNMLINCVSAQAMSKLT
ncbi:hypothetical protein ACOSQ4_001067 [Xanthoceras sorbifolium]